jgi:glucose/arabinose dehydrogenase
MIRCIFYPDSGTNESIPLSSEFETLIYVEMKLSATVGVNARMHCLPMAIALLFLVNACGGGGDEGSGEGARSSAAPGAAPTAASIMKTVEVPDSLAEGPFATSRSLNVPQGFGVRLWARVEGARFMALAPNADVLVSVPASGQVFLLRERENDVPQQFEFAGGLDNPHDIVFHQIDGVTYLYIAESNRVTRSVYTPGATRTAEREVVVADLPDASTPELGGAYNHQLKNIALSPEHKLYVSIASSCDACTADVESDPVRGAIYQYDADGSNRRLFARGVRNAEGLDFLPGTNHLWAAMIGRDQIPYPFDDDFDGDGESDYGRVMQPYVDDNPPELFTRVRDGGHYGWPFCNPLPNPDMTNLALVRDYSLNRDGASLDCSTVDRGLKGIAAHSTPLGVSFLHGSNVPVAYRQGAVVALHGCWNCSSFRAGFKVIYFPFDAAGNPGAEMDLVSGFVIDPDAHTLWGRPVDAIADAKGNILISDDHAGAIYQLYPVIQ